MSSVGSVKIEIPVQSIATELDQESAIQFFRDELAFVNKLQSLLQEPVVLNGSQIRIDEIHRRASRHITNIVNELQSDFEGERTNLNEYIAAANSLALVVGTGVVGKRVSDHLANGALDEARWQIAIYSKHWSDERLNQKLTAFRAVTVDSPATFHLVNVTSAENALDAANNARQKSEEDQKTLRMFLREKESLISDLADLYREKLVIAEPAKFWKTTADTLTKRWRIWLTVFMLFVAAPLLVIVGHWDGIAKAISAITSNGNGAVTFAGVAAITVPALLYGWLLKNVSRVFIQSLSLADDAAHRHALAVTYLGLAENEKLTVTENDRALILNALFRPQPTGALDEGPPKGLLELIGGKGSN